jgi:hypothetical protein
MIRFGVVHLRTVGERSMLGSTNAQRALWTFLFYTLIGPFLAALAMLGIMLIGPMLGLDGVVFEGKSMSFVEAAIPAALNTYIWAAFPAALAGAGLAALISLRGTFGWLESAIAGAAAMTIAALITQGVVGVDLTFAAFGAACIAIVCRGFLQRAQIVPTA